ncbi:MAG: DnaJ domain-containing protein [Planctomycetota bacterium]
MDCSKDYYSILGVLPDAEDVVIRAAYKALVHRYHPDKWDGDPQLAHQKTAELNEAYDVLSDPQRRSKYDQGRAVQRGSYESDEKQDESFDGELSQLEGRWNVAIQIFPDLAQIRQKLAKTAHRLAFAYMVLLLETKNFQEREQIAELMEQSFLERYFGTDPRIILFARELISFGFKDAIRSLNKYVDVMGSNVSADLLIQKVEEEHKLASRREELDRAKDAASISRRINQLKKILKNGASSTFLANNAYTPEAFELASLLGYKISHKQGGIFSDDQYTISLNGDLLFSGSDA